MLLQAFHCQQVIKNIFPKFPNPETSVYPCIVGMDNNLTKSEVQRIQGQLMFNGIHELKVRAENSPIAHSASRSPKTVCLLLALETITRN